MKRFKPWWQQDKRYMTFTQAVLLALLPVLCCFVRCALDGETISSVWLPNSAWNDELFYYKQVEGILHYGYPQGYFGFNESHALKLSFAAWSPVLVFPWVLWGLLFGWQLWSPVVCNIVLTSLVCFAFVWLVKPAWKQLGVLALLFSLYTPFTRYMLSGMAEVLCFDMVILFLGLAVNYLDRRRTCKLVLLFIMGAVMTLMRPYLLLFLLLPSYLLIRRQGWKGAFGSAAVIGGTLALYACINHYLGAAYFAPLFFTDWIEAFFEQGIFGGIRFCITKLHYMGKSFLEGMVRGIRTGLPMGAYSCGYVVILCILAGQSFLDYRRFRTLGRASEDSVVRDEDNVAARRRLYNRLVIQLHLAFSFVAMFFALLLMYKLEEGSRHLLTFMTAGIFAIALMDTRFFKKAVLVGVTFAYFYIYMASDPLYYEIPYRQEEKVELLTEWEEIFDGRLELERESGVPNYDNSVIWVFQDETPDGSLAFTSWQFLYGLPEGFGISCCMREYIIENFDRLESRYLATLSGGTIDRMCMDAGYREIGREGELVIYKLRQ
ncbi:MAG: hypothetical protein NC517_05295 [Firmicutes bacterium]|nr:hypothetical protein [Bacillota bacterium]